MTYLQRVYKINPWHDKGGQFTSKDKDADGVSGAKLTQEKFSPVPKPELAKALNDAFAKIPPPIGATLSMSGESTSLGTQATVSVVSTSQKRISGQYLKDAAKTLNDHFAAEKLPYAVVNTINRGLEGHIRVVNHDPEKTRPKIEHKVK